ncbi:19823_t:CDS:2 [Cetraspora pellucida]|uniref:19823_t:CDS:1 n=1 Tax=Cetraspora pellucida TaxID=1433469 RepID=A0A9N9IEQ4_9GLOM|nr:19823_t:CDS:2 [Cetraspora pellucida]
MKPHQTQFLSSSPLTSIHSTRLDSQAFYHSQSNRNNTFNSYSSFARRNIEQRITTIKNRETLPRYQTSNSIYFDKTFAQHAVYSRKSRWFRQALTIIMMGFIGFYLIHSWFIHNNSLTKYFLVSPQSINIGGQILLYRILGNDLPPQYLKYDFRLEDFPEPDFFHSNEFMNLSKVSKLRAIDYTYHEKNLYAINNNGGRNAALAHGKSQHNVSWILPFDGNCFLTPNAFADIRSHLYKWGEKYKYFIVPMARLINNSQLLNGSDTRPITPEEPQIIFRHDSNKTFNGNMRYGRRPKLDMLWRLGVPTTSRNFNRTSAPWESHHDSYKFIESDQYKTIGWVFRLFSGQASQELNQKEASALRSFNRLLAIQNFIDGLDERLARKVHGFNPFQLFLYDEKLLSQARSNFWLQVPNVVETVQVLIKRADEISSVVINLFESERGIQDEENTLVHFLKVKSNIYNLFHQPVESVDKTINFLPNVDDNKVSLNNNFKEYFSTPDSFFENVMTLVLAHYFSGNEKYAKWAANLIRTFVLSSYAIEDRDNSEFTSIDSDFESVNVEGYGFPNLNKIPRTIPKILKVDTSLLANITDADPSFFLDACRLLYRTNILTHKEYMELRMFASDWLEVLINSKAERNSDHRGIIFDLQVLSLAGFVDDLRLYLRIVNRVRMRIGKQFHVSRDLSTHEIKQNYEIMYVQNLLDTGKIKPSDYDENIFRYTTLNLHYWLLLIRGVQNGHCGSDIWQYTAKDGQRISKAVMEHLKLYANKIHDVSLIHIAKTAYIINKFKQCTRKEPKDELEYFQHLANVSDSMNFTLGNRIDDNELNTRIGIGSEARRRGLPPFWMLGVA